MMVYPARPPEDRERFVQLLRQYGTVKWAASEIGINASTAYDWRKGDADFAAAWDRALEHFGGRSRVNLVNKAAEGYGPAILAVDRVANPEDHQTNVRVKHEGTVYFSPITRAPTLDELPTTDTPALDAEYREVQN